MICRALTITTCLLASTAAPAWGNAATGQAPSTGESTEVSPYSPALREPTVNRLLWGDLHLHTKLSMDAYVNGTRRLGQEDAYRFAMGETVVADNGVPARLRRPLDFLAVTDHGENLGLYASIAAGDPKVAGSDIDRRWSEVLELVGELGLRGAFQTAIGKHGPLPPLPEEVLRSTWREVAALSDRYNQPGRFSTLTGYEWTSMVSGDNLHRVVLYRDDASLAGASLPVNAQLDPDPETLWAALARYEKTGGKVLAIAHNGNLSNGRMFAPTRLKGQPLTTAYAEARARWEPVYEVTQVKGDGESHPALSPEDAFSDFENWDEWNVAETAPKEPWMLRYEYARPALGEGLRHERELGVNPFRFGMIGSSDIHTALSTTAEDNFFGKFPTSEPSPERFAPEPGSNRHRNRELAAAGLTAVWARENTREAIFDALRRREVYATTGTRIGLRFFGGWNFVAADIHRPDYDRHGYRNGVAMGGELSQCSGDCAPAFLVHAARDPRGAFLDRIQIVKGWVEDDGVAREKIYDVALSDRRRRQGDRVAEVGSSVDIEAATYSNSIGAPELAAWWRDPEFDPKHAAFYYVRVLEIPTPRWTTYDAAFYGSALPDDVPATLQERAYSSPIWYQPHRDYRAD